MHRASVYGRCRSQRNPALFYLFFWLQAYLGNAAMVAILHLLLAVFCFSADVVDASRLLGRPPRFRASS